MSLATVIVLVVELIAIFLNVTLFPTALKILGIVVAGLDNVLFLLSVITMGNNWRAGVNKSEKNSLVTNGIYSISRNPAFMAFDLVYIGILLMFFVWWHLMIATFDIVMLHIQIVTIEELFFPSVFVEEYIDYKNRVGKYLGREF